MSWLSNVVIETTKPKDSIIGVIRKNLAGYQDARDRSQLHASDITKDTFCPRQWHLEDVQDIKPNPQYIPTALATTFSLGNSIARLFIENWAGQSVIGNWECLICGAFKTLSKNPSGWCNSGKKHIWKYHEFVVEAKEYDVSGSIDAIFDLGSPLWHISELKILAAEAFEKIVVPMPEHRIRTSLYLKLIAESTSVWKQNFNLQEARIVYVSRGYGKANPQWDGEILPIKEFVIKRDDASTDLLLKKAKALKLARGGGGVPSGICSTALDAPAKKCNVCKSCFSGDYKATINLEDL